MGCLKLTERDFLKLHNCSKKTAISWFFHIVPNDPIGSRLSATTNKNEILLAYNDLNQITTATPAKVDVLSKLAGDYKYDNFGNLISTPKANYRYNLNNRLVEVNQKDNKLTFDYDPNGRRTDKQVFNKDGKLIRHMKFLYSGFKCVAEIDAMSNKVLKFNEWQGEQLLGVYNPQSEKSLSCLIDGNKNVIGLMGSNGEISAKFAYSPFGKLLTTQGADIADCSFGFSSEYQDKESGLVYYNYRYYSAELGRWLNRDPIKEMGGDNMYGIVDNKITNNADLFGLLYRVKEFFIGATQKIPVIGLGKDRYSLFDEIGTMQTCDYEVDCIYCRQHDVFKEYEVVKGKLVWFDIYIKLSIYYDQKKWTLALLAITQFIGSQVDKTPITDTVNLISDLTIAMKDADINASLTGLKTIKRSKQVLFENNVGINTLILTSQIAVSSCDNCPQQYTDNPNPTRIGLTKEELNDLQ